MLLAEEIAEKGSTAPSQRVEPAYKLRYTLQGHTDAISSVEFSPDGRLLATASNDSTIKLWTATTGKYDCTLTGHKAGISDVTWSQDSKYLASASDDHTVIIWSLGKKQASKTLVGHTDFVFCVRYNPQGTLLASGSFDETVRVWDVKKGKTLIVLAGHTQPVTTVHFNRDGTLLATGSMDGTIKIWDPSNGGQLLKTLTEPIPSPVSFLKFSPNGKYILSSSWSSTLTLWSYQRAETLRHYRGHRCEAFCCAAAYSVTGGKWIVSGSEDGSVYLWDLHSKPGEYNQNIQDGGREEVGVKGAAAGWVQRLEGHKDVVVAVSCHPTKNIIASGALGKDNTVKLWFSDT